jgi:hypothetical protein
MSRYSHFDTLNHLQTGTPTQQAAWQVLTRYQVWEKLQPFTPVLAGTIPININIENSDLDILCYYQDHKGYMENLVDAFSQYPGFRFYETSVRDIPAIITSFTLDNFPVEIFAQPQPVTTQWGYRHMMIEHHLLQTRGEDFRQQIIALKKDGYKTEPAFARLLGLSGDPYEALLEIPLP